MGQVQPFATEEQPITISLASGIYNETVQVTAHVRLAGLDPLNRSRTQILPTNLQPGAIVIQAAEDTALRDLSVQLPSDAPTGVTLLQINDVTMEVSNVAFN